MCDLQKPPDAGLSNYPTSTDGRTLTLLYQARVLDAAGGSKTITGIESDVESLTFPDRPRDYSRRVLSEDFQ